MIHGRKAFNKKMIGLGTLAELEKSGLEARSLRMATSVRDLIRKS